jgi:hypothetical protein
VFPVGYILVAHLNRASKPASRSRPSPDTTNRLRRGELVYADKQALRIGAVVLASLALVFWSQPTGKVVLLLAGLLLVALALIELLGRPPNAPSSPPQPERDPGCGSSTPKRVYHCRVG